MNAAEKGFELIETNFIIRKENLPFLYDLVGFNPDLDELSGNDSLLI